MKLLLMYYRSVVGRQMCRIISRPFSFFFFPVSLSPRRAISRICRAEARASERELAIFARWKKSVSDIFHAAKITLTATTWNVSEGTMKIYRVRHRCSTPRPRARARARIDNSFLVCLLAGLASLQAAGYNAIKSLARALSHAGPEHFPRPPKLRK